jgi:hypothetical protein
MVISIMFAIFKNILDWYELYSPWAGQLLCQQQRERTAEHLMYGQRPLQRATSARTKWDVARQMKIRCALRSCTHERFYADTAMTSNGMQKPVIQYKKARGESHKNP